MLVEGRLVGDVWFVLVLVLVRVRVLSVGLPALCCAAQFPFET